jgi:protein phosphatase
MRLADVASLSDPGRVRRRNEDAFVCEPPLFAVADGMGGAQAGELASRLATAAMREYRAEASLDPETHLRSSIQEANRRIYARAASDPQVSGMGTTVTAALVADGRVAVGHVGDSRAYRIRDGALEQLTQDHSLVADLVRSGRLTPEEAEVHPQRSVITRALGTDAGVQVDSFSVDARPGDVFLLCSDGLTTMVDDDAVLKTVRKSHSLEASARSLVQAANKAGGEDNVTVILFSFADGDQAPLPAAATVPDAPVVAAPQAVNGGRPAAAAPAAARPKGERRVGRAMLVVLLVLVLFAAVAAVALWGLSRAHFVGVGEDGRVTVYQGVPWNLVGSVHLYREVYVSNLLAVQLTPEERQALLDHELVSEAEAKAQIAVYERQAFPS